MVRDARWRTNLRQVRFRPIQRRGAVYCCSFGSVKACLAIGRRYGVWVAERPFNTRRIQAKREGGSRGDIVNALRNLPRVVRVEANISIPEADPLRDINQDPPKPKAGILLVFRPTKEGTPPITVKDVQNFVQASLPEIKSENVSVTMMPAADDAAAGGGDAVQRPIIDPTKGCVEKEAVIGIDVCKGIRQKVIKAVLVAVIVAGLLAGLAVVAVLRAMRYRKDLTRLTAQFQRHGK